MEVFMLMGHRTKPEEHEKVFFLHRWCCTGGVFSAQVVSPPRWRSDATGRGAELPNTLLDAAESIEFNKQYMNSSITRLNSHSNRLKQWKNKQLKQKGCTGGVFSEL